MSAPLQNSDKLEDLQLYAPPWAREFPPSSTVHQPPIVQPPAAQPQAVQPEAAQPQAADSPTTAPALGDAEVDPEEQSAPSLWPQAESPPMSPAHMSPAHMAPAHLMTSAPPMAPEARPAAIERREPPERREPSERWERSERRKPAEPPVAPQRTSGKPLPRMAPGVGGPNLDWRPPPHIDWPSPTSRLPPFEGDLAVKALRQRLSLDPELLPEPPIRARQRSILPFLSRFCLVAAVAAVVAYGVTMLSVPDLRPISFKPDQSIQDQGIVAAAEPAPAEIPAATHAPARLVIEGRQAFANEPLPLGVSLNGASGGEFALLTGLAAGTRLSVGTSLGGSGWRLAARDLASAYAYAPKDFVGVMDAAIDLRTSRDALVDRNVMRLEWIGKQQPELRAPPRPERNEPAQIIPVIQPIGGEELATLLKRGLDYLKTGDIAAARLVLRRAAGAGNAQAALALGATFDPFVFRELGVLGFAADAAQARAWYERAGQLGAPEAAGRLERLTRVRQ